MIRLIINLMDHAEKHSKNDTPVAGTSKEEGAADEAAPFCLPIIYFEDVHFPSF